MLENDCLHETARLRSHRFLFCKFLQRDKADGHIWCRSSACARRWTCQALPHKSSLSALAAYTGRFPRCPRIFLPAPAGAVVSLRRWHADGIWEYTPWPTGCASAPLPWVQVPPRAPNNDNPNDIIQAGSVIGFIISIENVLWWTRAGLVFLPLPFLWNPYIII